MPHLVLVGAALVLGLVFAPSLASPLPFEHGEQPQTPGEVGTPLVAMSDTELQWVSDYLATLLREDPWEENESPLLYVEPARPGASTPPGPGAPGSPGAEEDDLNALSVHKRSRYYRRYPWKRVTRTRGSYDPDLYMCNPSREDVIQLLVGLHRAREGDTGRTINFCNRKRPASAVFTNIRFIGRK